jgi:hypothetical protein
MKQLNDVEVQATILLKELEYSIVNGSHIPANVINQMSILKQSILDANEQLAKDLEIMYSFIDKN